MSLNYGQAPDPEDFIIGLLLPLGLPVSPERDEETDLPCYVVTVLPGTSDRFMMQPVVSVHSFAKTRDVAAQAARNADNVLISTTPADNVTLANGDIAPGAWVEPMSPPAFAEYRDPDIKRYVGRYRPMLRFTATQS